MNPLSQPLLSSRPSKRTEQAKMKRRRRESWKNGKQWLDVRSEPPRSAPRSSKERDLHSQGSSEESQRSAEDSSLTPLLTFQVKSPTNKGKSTRETEGKSGEEKEGKREQEQANTFHLLCPLN
ncbi:hypothetical protein ROHU_026412 [Labeo rohita]|uniref:Uncharacterized protein n=1 Tax=Labeo rohita TaxID=84645 RepID=A0A498MAZ3_LABRO|nr:hypothetical protein ROHU_026412 [Labeo rohita]